jgi:hypothetical protein
MGKGSETLDRLSLRVLTSPELRARKAAAEAGGDDIEATPDGRLVKVMQERTREVTRVPASTWD